MHRRVLVPVTLSCLLFTTAFVGGSVFVDVSERLPPSIFTADTDITDMDFVDVDGDGDLDLFVSGGSARASSAPNALYINDGEGLFTDESATRLPAGSDDVSGRVDFADLDGDGDLDAVVPNLGTSQLLLNNGGGVFTDATNQLPPQPFTGPFDADVQIAPIDVDGDGDLDLYVSNETVIPGALGQQNRLWINDGNASFTDETAARLPIEINNAQLSMVGDLDLDGDDDLVNLALGQELVLLNDGTGFFTDATAALFPTVSDATRGGALEDFDGDGCLDLFVVNSSSTQNRFYLGDCTGAFTDATVGRVPTLINTTASLTAGDLDGDGDTDLVTGNAGPAMFGPSGLSFPGEQNQVLINVRGFFVDVTPVFLPLVDDPTATVSLGDIDNDGDLDLAVGTFANDGTPPVELLLNSLTGFNHVDDDDDDDGFANCVDYGVYDSDHDDDDE